MAGQPGEQHRLASARRPGQPVPQADPYANAEPGEPASTRMSVVVDYGEHEFGADEAYPWPARLDAYSDHHAGSEVRTWRLCRRLMMFAVVAALGGSALSFIGLIHGAKVGWNANGQVALGYLFLAAVCAAFALLRPPPRVPEPDELELDRQHGAAAGRPAATERPVTTEQLAMAVRPVVTEQPARSSSLPWLSSRSRPSNRPWLSSPSRSPPRPPSSLVGDGCVLPRSRISAEPGRFTEPFTPAGC